MLLKWTVVCARKALSKTPDFDVALAFDGASMGLAELGIHCG